MDFLGQWKMLKFSNSVFSMYYEFFLWILSSISIVVMILWIVINQSKNILHQFFALYHLQNEHHLQKLVYRWMNETHNFSNHITTHVPREWKSGCCQTQTFRRVVVHRIQTCVVVIEWFKYRVCTIMKYEATGMRTPRYRYAMQFSVSVQTLNEHE